MSKKDRANYPQTPEAEWMNVSAETLIMIKATVIKGMMMMMMSQMTFAKKGPSTRHNNCFRKWGENNKTERPSKPAAFVGNFNR